MTQPLITERVRSTAATTQKSSNIKRIIEALCMGEMTRQTISELLSMSPSGTRKYIADLKREHVMVTVRQDGATSWHNGHDVYRLNPDVDVIDSFLAKLEAGTVPKSPAKRGENAAEVRSGLHICSDDMAFSVKVSGFKIPAPDPVLAHFFGRVA